MVLSFPFSSCTCPPDEDKKVTKDSMQVEETAKEKLRYRESNPGLRGTDLSGYESAKC